MKASSAFEPVTDEQAKTIEALQQEYNQKCGTAGDLQYRIQAYQWDLEKVNAELKAINQKAAEMKRKEREAPVAAPVAEVIQ